MIFIALDRLDDAPRRGPQLGHDADGRRAQGARSATSSASMEETTTGVIRLRAMEKDGVLKLPGHRRQRRQTKHFFDNRYGTGQSTIDGVIRATEPAAGGPQRRRLRLRLVRQGRRDAGPGHGLARDRHRDRPDPRRSRPRWTASRSSRSPRPRSSATCSSPSPATSTSSAREHFAVMKDGAMICNSGHFNVELALDELAKRATSRRDDPRVRRRVRFKRRPTSYVLGEGRLINLAAAHGHPASVMDMSFAAQALATEYLVKNHGTLGKKVYSSPRRSTPRSRASSSSPWASRSTPSPPSRRSTWRDGKRGRRRIP